MVRPGAKRRLPALAVPPRKPMAMARRVSLFEREVTVRLSPAALDVLFDAAKVLTEGSVEHGRYYGSTMMTIDLARTTDRVSDDCDAADVRRVAELMIADEQARERARRVAIAETRRTGVGPLEGIAVDVRVRPTGRHLHLDLDVEAARRKP